MSTDAIVLLKEDHQQIRKLFRQFQDAGPDATKTEGDLVSKIIEALTVHTYIENVRHHMDEEEDEWFPKVRAGLGRKALQDIGAHLIELKEKAPRSPAQPSALKKTVDAIIS